MRILRRILIVFVVLGIVAGAAVWYLVSRPNATLPLAAVTGPSPRLVSPGEELPPAIAPARLVDWPAGEGPRAAPGLSVTAFAEELDHPRWLTLLPNGDVLVAEASNPEPAGVSVGGRVFGWALTAIAGGGEASANRITLLRDTDRDGRADARSVLLEGLNSPFGMTLVGDTLYVANTDAIISYPFEAGQARIAAPGRKVADLPANPPNNHWTRNLVASPDGTRLFVSVGSNSNFAEHGLDIEANRAVILEVDPASGRSRVLAGGLRNAVGMAWEPVRQRLWTVVHERDGIGGDVAPDYLTEVERGGFYGWPWYFWGGIEDPRVEPKRPGLRERTRRPDYALGPHVAPLGLAFADGAALGPRFASGAFVGLHGSIVRRPRSGYKVVFIPFGVDGRPSGAPVDVLSGFLDAEGRTRGRPAGVILDGTGALLVADDAGNRVWRVRGRQSRAIASR